jgi:hypothetical protein
MSSSVIRFHPTAVVGKPVGNIPVIVMNFPDQSGLVLYSQYMFIAGKAERWRGGAE